MTPYLVTLLVTLVCAVALIPKITRCPAMVVAFFFLAGFAGLRSEIGWDYEAYQYLYDAFVDQGLVETFAPGQAVDLLGFEPGFSFFIWLISAVGANYQLACAIVTVGCSLFAAYRLAPAQALPLFLVIYLWYGYYHNFSILRQGMAAGIIFVALALFRDHKKLSTALYALASTIHFSVIGLAPLLAACIRFSTRKVLFVALGLCWILSLSSFGAEIISSLLTLIGRERWQNLLAFGELTTKVGVSLILVEYTILVMLLAAVDSETPAMRFARGVLVYRLATYGVFNDISIAWERSNAFADPMYALALAIILASFVNRLCKPPLSYRLILTGTTIAMCFYVAFKYDRMLSSDPRIEGERSHYERFVPYRMLFDN